jgi:hypothetical protein
LALSLYSYEGYVADIQLLRSGLVATVLWLGIGMVVSGCGRQGGAVDGQAFAGSADPADGYAVQFRGDLVVGSYVLVADAQLFNKSAKAVVLVSLSVSLKGKGVVDEGHLAFSPRGSASFYATWTPGDPLANQPASLGTPVPIRGAIIPAHSYFHDENTSTFAKLRLKKAGTYEAEDLVIRYRQDGRLYKQSIASGYQLWTKGSPPAPLGRAPQSGVEHTTAPPAPVTASK